MKEAQKELEKIPQLICSLTRYCGLKEDYFASSFNLSPAEVKLLKLFSMSKTYTIKELRESLLLTSGRITHIISTLESKKLIERTQDPEDKRNIIVTLSPKAEPLIENLDRSYKELHDKIFRNIKQEDLDSVLSSLKTLVNVFNIWETQR